MSAYVSQNSKHINPRRWVHTKLFVRLVGSAYCHHSKLLSVHVMAPSDSTYFCASNTQRNEESLPCPLPSDRGSSHAISLQWDPHQHLLRVHSLLHHFHRAGIQSVF